MNNRGQTLIIFILLLPLAFLLMAFIIDTSLIVMEKTKLESTTRTILKTTYKMKEDSDYETKVIELYQKNEIPIDNLMIENKEQSLKITNTYEKESIFGKIIGIASYKIKCTLHMDDTLKIEKE